MTVSITGSPRRADRRREEPAEVSPQAGQPLSLEVTTDGAVCPLRVQVRPPEASHGDEDQADGDHPEQKQTETLNIPVSPPAIVPSGRKIESFTSLLNQSIISSIY